MTNSWWTPYTINQPQQTQPQSQIGYNSWWPNDWEIKNQPNKPMDQREWDPRLANTNNPTLKDQFDDLQRRDQEEPLLTAET